MIFLSEMSFLAVAFQIPGKYDKREVNLFYFPGHTASYPEFFFLLMHPKQKARLVFLIPAM